MLRQTISVCVFVALAAAYSMQPVETQANRSTPVVLYEGARLIAGDGSAPIADSAFLVENGTITKVGKKGEVTAPGGAGRINLTGKTVMPTLINAHGHPASNEASPTARTTSPVKTSSTISIARCISGWRPSSRRALKRGVTYQIRADQEAGSWAARACTSRAAASARRMPDRAAQPTPGSRMK